MKVELIICSRFALKLVNPGPLHVHLNKLLFFISKSLDLVVTQVKIIVHFAHISLSYILSENRVEQNTHYGFYWPTPGRGTRIYLVYGDVPL